MGVEADTTVRDRRQARSNSNTDNDLQSSAAFTPEPAQVERIFRPDGTDLDDLAEAVRALLEHGGKASHLLSVAPRGTHVVEAAGTHCWPLRFTPASAPRSSESANPSGRKSSSGGRLQAP